MGGIIGGIIQGRAARRAAAAQERAAQADLAFQRETRDLIFQRTDPFYKTGIGANNALAYEMGLGAKPQDYAGFQATPGYQFQFDQGTGAVNALAGARGGLDSGRTRQDLMQFGQGLANQEYSNYLNRLTGMAGAGQNAAGTQANAATNAASGVSNALAAQGNAQSAGAIGVGNAWANGLNNQIGLFQYQRGVGGGGGLNIGRSGSLFGGNSWG